MSRERERALCDAIEAGQRMVLDALLATRLAPRLGIYADTTRGSEPVAKALVLLEAAVKSLADAQANDELACTDHDYGFPTAALRSIEAKVRHGDQCATIARAELVEAHLRLVVGLAQRQRDDGFEKAIQQGSLALLAAACTFDHRAGERFSAYASRALRGVAQSNAISSVARVVGSTMSSISTTTWSGSPRATSSSGSTSRPGSSRRRSGNALAPRPERLLVAHHTGIAHNV